jgi:SHS2 domain-containing protein
VTIEHVGEYRVEVEARDLAGVFCALARAIANECGVATGEPLPWRLITVAAADRDALVVDWCNELIGLCEVDHVAYDECRGVQLFGDTRVMAEVRGRRVVDWQSAIKAATFHGLVLERRNNGWYCSILFDV